MHSVFLGFNGGVPRKVLNQSIGSKTALLVDFVYSLEVHTVNPLIRRTINSKLMRMHIFKYLFLLLDRFLFIIADLTLFFPYFIVEFKCQIAKLRKRAWNLEAGFLGGI